LLLVDGTKYTYFNLILPDLSQEGE
jgi:hypothetical protein